MQANMGLVAGLRSAPARPLDRAQARRLGRGTGAAPRTGLRVAADSEYAQAPAVPMAVPLLRPPATPHALNYYHHPPGQRGAAFYMPRLSLLGPGALEAAAAEIRALGLKKALLVTDKYLGDVARATVTHMLDSIGVGWALFEGVTPNPTVAQVEEGLARAQAGGCDCVVSFGGGSPHDAAKAIALLATNGGDIRDYEGVNKVARPTLPLVCINTTAGTAAELTRFAIITDPQRATKMAIIDSKLTPALAVDDPTLMLSLPPAVTAAIGMDALTHAVEAFLSTASTPLTDACALHAVRLVATYLRDAVHAPADLRARDMMAYAAYLAGAAFNSAGLGTVHAMAHALGGRYDLPHGACNAVLLPVVLAYSAPACPALFIDLAQALGFSPGEEDGEEAAAEVVRGVRRLAADVGIPRSLQGLGGGVRPEDFESLAEAALRDACGATAPRQPTRAEVVALYREAYRG